MRLIKGVVDQRKHRYRYLYKSIFIVTIMVALLWGFVYQNSDNKLGAPDWALVDSTIGSDKEKTLEYISQFEPSRYESLGSDYDNSIYSPERFGETADHIDHVYDYDFNRVNRTEAFLQGVDRLQALKYIFNIVTEHAITDKEKHRAVLSFLQKSGYRNMVWQPMYSDKVMVQDPLVLLELHEMRCGQVARLAVDLFNAAGYKSRLIQLGGHVIAEVFYDMDWHYFDADYFGGGETIVDSSGEIPSTAELSRTRNGYLLDALALNSEYINLPIDESLVYPSYHYFSQEAYSGYLPSYYIKTATLEESLNYLYGWNYYDTVRYRDVELNTLPVYYMPGAVAFTSIQIDDELNLAVVKWSESEDADGDLLGYKVFVSSSSRGWDYLEFSGAESLLPFWNAAGDKDWNSASYTSLFKLPPHEVALITTKENSVRIPIIDGNRYYVTVMPFDAHGESVGKKLFFMSNEIVLIH